MYTLVKLYCEIKKNNETKIINVISDNSFINTIIERFYNVNSKERYVINRIEIKHSENGAIKYQEKNKFYQPNDVFYVTLKTKRLILNNKMAIEKEIIVDSDMYFIGKTIEEVYRYYEDLMNENCSREVQTDYLLEFNISSVPEGNFIVL